MQGLNLQEDSLHVWSSSLTNALETSGRSSLPSTPRHCSGSTWTTSTPSPRIPIDGDKAHHRNHERLSVPQISASTQENLYYASPTISASNARRSALRNQQDILGPMHTRKASVLYLQQNFEALKILPMKWLDFVETLELHEVLVSNIRPTSGAIDHRLSNTSDRLNNFARLYDPLRQPQFSALARELCLVLYNQIIWLVKERDGAITSSSNASRPVRERSRGPRRRKSQQWHRRMARKVLGVAEEEQVPLSRPMHADDRFVYGHPAPSQASQLQVQARLHD